MATTLTVTRNDLITSAIGKLGVLARGQTPDSEDLDKGALSLNMLIGHYRTKGLFLWKRTKKVITPSSGTKKYDIGSGKDIDTKDYPLHILDAYSTYNTGNQNVPIDIISEIEYNRLPTMAVGTQPLKLTFTPDLQFGTVKIWPTPDSTASSNYTFTVSYQAPFNYPSSGTDTLDFPDEWLLPITYKLACLLAPEWGIPLEDRRMLEALAKQYEDAADGYGIEDASLFVQPRKN